MSYPKTDGARTYFMHNGELVSLHTTTLAGIEHDDHFDTGSELRDTMIDKALMAEKLAPGR